ncbi:leukocyte surface antigen CD53 [Aphidius gifuensis]|uniref:leukocyte surface antigen CD53 n=1 Tax=Aphidius gifuensis TaxID=684658 RepID=UPI001CDB89AB|nr:leukocyte surface antigen CD53 [Aphidius gifuensis]
MKSCGMSTIKYLLFGFNLVFSLSGLAVLIAGMIVLADVDEFSHFVEGSIFTTSFVLIIVGVIIFIVAFLGCFGAIKEHYILLIVFAGILAVIFVIEMTVGITAAVYKGDFSDVLKNGLKKSMKNYSNNEADKIAWDNVQIKLDCCGVEKADEWIGIGVLPGGQLPPSCCKEKSNIQCLLGDSTQRQNGCYTKLVDKIKGNANVIIYLGIIILIAGIVLACSLAMAIKNDRKDEE